MSLPQVMPEDDDDVAVVDVDVVVDVEVEVELDFEEEEDVVSSPPLPPPPSLPLSPQASAASGANMNTKPSLRMECLQNDPREILLRAAGCKSDGAPSAISDAFPLLVGLASGPTQRAKPSRSLSPW
jgi:hypothetical protein